MTARGSRTEQLSSEAITELLSDVEAFLGASSPVASDRVPSAAPTVATSSQSIVAIRTTAEGEKEERCGREAGRRRNQHRERERRERMYLRASVDLLTRELQDRLKHQELREQVGRFEKRPARTMLFKHLALRNRLLRQDAERANAQLRALAANQLQLAAELYRLQILRSPVARQADRTCLAREDVDVFESFLATMNQLVAQTDETMQRSSVVTAAASTHRTLEWAKYPGAGHQFLQVHDHRVVPLSYASVQREYWRLVVHAVLQRRDVQYQSTQHASNTMTLKYRESCVWRGISGYIDITEVITSRFSEERQVIVWRALKVGGGSLTGLNCEEIGWSVLAPTPEASNQCDLNGFIKRIPMMSSNRPRRDNVKVVRAPDFKEFTQVLLDATDTDLERLLARVVATGKHSSIS